MQDNQSISTSNEEREVQERLINAKQFSLTWYKMIMWCGTCDTEDPHTSDSPTSV